jgi:hypothetical protein
MDMEYPGTAAIFYHPLWVLIDFRKLLGPDELRNLFIVMGTDVYENFVEYKDRLGRDSQPEESRFWRGFDRPTSFLSSLTGLDGPAAGLIEARMGFLGQVEEDFVGYMIFSKVSLVSLASTPPFASKAMHSALLVLEYLCLKHAYQLVMITPRIHEKQNEQAKKVMLWTKEWKSREEGHRRRLSIRDNIKFAKIMNEASGRGLQHQRSLQFA